MSQKLYIIKSQGYLHKDFFLSISFPFSHGGNSEFKTYYLHKSSRTYVGIGHPCAVARAVSFIVSISPNIFLSGSVHLHFWFQFVYFRKS